VKRPSGAEVVFSFKGTGIGRPVNLNKRYWAANVTGGALEVHFPGLDNAVHRFDSNGRIQQVRRTVEHVELSVDGSPTAWPKMTTYKSGSQITSNKCPIVDAYPQYAASLITSVTYKTNGLY